MPFSELQIFHPSAISGFTIRTDALPKPLTLPHNLTPADKERLVILLLSALRAGGVQLGNVIHLRWENRFWLNSPNPPSIACRSEDVFRLIVEEPVESAELFRFVDGCDCLTLIDFRYPSEDEHVQWMAALKNSMLDAVQTWWRRFVQHDEAGEVNFTPVRRWFESPIDALDYCNTIAAGLFDGHSLIYVERQAMAAILAGKAQSLSAESLMALVAFALRERWQQLRFAESKPLPDFAPHFAEWQTAGLGWLAGDEFVPLPALERLQERETRDPFFARWDREREENAAMFSFWDELRAAMVPPVVAKSYAESRFSSPDAPVRPAVKRLGARTHETPKGIREDISAHFPELPPDADDVKLQDAMAKEPDVNRRLLLLAWRACLWLDKAADREVSRDQSLRAENDLVRTIAQIWKDLRPQPADSASAFVAENWGRLRTALADHLTERAQIGATRQLITAAREHLTQSLAVFRMLNCKQYEANVLGRMGDLQMRVDDLAGARGSYEKALPIYCEIEDRLGEAYVLKAMGDLLMRVADLAGARAIYEKVLPIYREIEDRLGEANTLKTMGDLLMVEGEPDEAMNQLLSVLRIHADIYSQINFDSDLIYLERASQAAELHDQAVLISEEALLLARRLGDRWNQALALEDQGDAFNGLDDEQSAHAAWWQARELFRSIGEQFAASLDQLFAEIEEKLGEDQYRVLTKELQSSAEKMRSAAVAKLAIQLKDNSLLREIRKLIEQLNRKL